MRSSSGSDLDADTPSSAKVIYNKDADDGKQRFLLELEFVQCLANPTYIHYLAQNRFFEDEAFIRYLKFLQYWHRPEYVKFIMYPHCLFFLDLLQNANFRNAMMHPANKTVLISIGLRLDCVSCENELAHRQQFYFWKNYRLNRLKNLLPRPPPEPSVVPAMPTSAPPSNPVIGITGPGASVPPSMHVPSPPMQYNMSSSSTFVKNDMRGGNLDHRKRKKEP